MMIAAAAAEHLVVAAVGEDQIEQRAADQHVVADIVGERLAGRIQQVIDDDVGDAVAAVEPAVTEAADEVPGRLCGVKLRRSMTSE